MDYLTVIVHISTYSKHRKLFSEVIYRDIIRYMKLSKGRWKNAHKNLRILWSQKQASYTVQKAMVVQSFLT